MNIFEPAASEDGSPPSITFGEIARSVAPALRPPMAITVDEAAERFRFIRYRSEWRKFDNAVTPYMIEPQRMVTNRRYGTVCFVGPARSGKTAAIVENPIAHAITCDPQTTHVVQMSFLAARTYAEEKIGAMIRNSPELRARQTGGPRGDNLLDKRFAGGMKLTIGWPVVSQLSSRDISRIILTDIDRMPVDVQGEGGPYPLARKRTQTEGSRAICIVESSPGFPIKRENWSPGSRHEAPPADGIASIYNDGTRARLYYHCLACGDPFEPTFERLEFDAEASTALEAGRSARLICPHCGGVMEQAQRSALNAAATWMHETAEGGIAPLGEATRVSDIVSYWLPGPAAAFASWAEIISRWLAAKRKADDEGDDAALKAVVNTDLGLSYLPRVTSDADELDAEALRAAARDYPLGVAPSWVRFVTIAVDTQKGRFVWQADAWGVNLERRLIQRGEIFQAPVGAPRAGDRPIDPARYAEDWRALDQLAELAFPIEGTEAAIRAVVIGVDMQGEAGVTDKARAFWRAKKKAGAHARWSLMRGRPTFTLEKRAWIARPETASKGKKAVKDVPILNLAVDRLKDEVYSQLTKQDAGPRSLALSSRLPGEVFDELAGERRTDKGWRKKLGVLRNEAFDLETYNLGLAIALKAERVDYDAPPAWAAEGARNALAFSTAPAPEVDPEAAPAGDEEPAARPVKIGRRRRSRRVPPAGGKVTW